MTKVFRKKKEKYDLLTTQEMIEQLQKDRLKDKTSNWKEFLLLLVISSAIVLLATGLMWIGT
jgi:hypothetical protein|tara:strand:+ start:325 stop:510 length:186 start_codon:yes stop_codon:yes gene_type:complete